MRARNSERVMRIDGNPYCCIFPAVKTTIDIPEALYKKAKIRAVEQGQTLKQVVIDSLVKELDGRSALEPKRELSFWEKRETLPAYQAALDAGGFSGGTDSAVIISEDRSSREDALL